MEVAKRTLNKGTLKGACVGGDWRPVFMPTVVS